MIQQLGYTKGTDGMFVDPGGQKLSVELRTTNRVGVQLSGQSTIVDYWQQVGVSVDQVVIPLQRQTDAQYRATFPSFEMLGPFPNDLQLIPSLVSSSVRLPENNFVSLNNYPRYQNRDLDELVERYLVTIPMPGATDRAWACGRPHRGERGVLYPLAPDERRTQRHDRHPRHVLRDVVDHTPKRGQSLRASGWSRGSAQPARRDRGSGSADSC